MRLIILMTLILTSTPLPSYPYTITAEWIGPGAVYVQWSAPGCVDFQTVDGWAGTLHCDGDGDGVYPAETLSSVPGSPPAKAGDVLTFINRRPPYDGTAQVTLPPPPPIWLYLPLAGG